VRLVEAIRRANQPLAPENSIRFRVACSATVLVAILAAGALDEISRLNAGIAIVLVTGGMVVSYVTRAHPPNWIKAVVAFAALAAVVWFFENIANNPLVDVTALFVMIQVVHSFHVPARRDLIFSLGASAGLMAANAAQAINLDFGLFVIAWVALGLWSLLEMWNAESGGGAISAVALGAALFGATLAAAAVFLVLPAPTVAFRSNFLANAGVGGAISIPGALAGDAGSPSQLSHEGAAGARIRVGGFLGFANSLNTGIRGSLSDNLIMLVRAQVPSYWVGETFDHWDGTSWTATRTTRIPLQQISPFALPIPEGDTGVGAADLQTFYIVSSTADLIFHAESADELWFPSSTIYFGSDGSMVSPIGLGKGTVYTVESRVDEADGVQPRHTTAAVLPADAQPLYTQLPHPYPRVKALARQVTAGDTTTYARVQALIGWIGSHTKYSTDIPPLPPGGDTVDTFLFGNRVGYCEQISTALSVMLRTIGIPAREVVGYVPGAYNPITDLYEVRANDAHAWVQVWIAGQGWQSFDPTASVPLANPAPGTTALRDLAHALSRIPPLPTASAVLAAVIVGALMWWRRIRARTWLDRILRDAERTGRRAGRPRLVHESLAEYASALDALASPDEHNWREIAVAVERYAYGGEQFSITEQDLLVTSARDLRIGRRKSIAAS
jgi:protein-glutamine gamma-glutamyltransferase